MAAKNKHPIVVRERPTVVAAVIIVGRHIVLVMTGNVWFANLANQLTATTQDLDALETAEALAKGRGEGAAQARNDKLAKVDGDLDALVNACQQVVNANLSQAATIATSAGMALKRTGARQKALLAAHPSGVPGITRLLAKAAKRGTSYEWQYSADGGKTWVAVGTTTVADTEVTGLTVGATYQFRFRTTYRKATTDWCQPLTYLVYA